MIRKHWLDMRQSGWFDFMVFLFVLGAVLLALGIAGTVQYNAIQETLGPNPSTFELKQAHTLLSKGHTALLFTGGFAAAVALLGFLSLRFLAPFVRADVRKQKALRHVRTGLQYAAAILLTLVMLFPIYWMIVSSLKSSDELLLAVPTLWPKEIMWQNYPQVLSRAPFGLYLFNTLVSTFLMMIGETVMGILAAYGFSKGEFKYKNLLFLMVLGAMMVPIQITFVPIYVMISRMGWLNTFAGLVLPNLVTAYFIFMLRQAFLSVDNSYIEAGKIDGMGRIGTIVHVLIPMCAPTVITISIISFINGWNNYFWPRMIAPLEARRTLAVGITQLRRTFAGIVTANYNEIMAGAVLAIVPIVVLFLFLQKFIMTGMSKAAMK
ncbi:MAG TPA: carbohydrate ABC transporter permease [Candidatus Limiplasma sp.]|nr:carbohydrate ABC transporter permease [Candidatus Limiplasma sp.]HRX09864.1 carbohydrate ABC transporter permease [Candidatus Limiplasma sp.]